MRINGWIIFGAMVSTSLMAQQTTNAPTAPSATPAAAQALTNASAGPAGTNAGALITKQKKKTPAKKPAARKPAAELKTVPLVPGPAVLVANNVNVRGKPSFRGEVVTRLTKGQEVTVLEEITRNNSAADEPSAWAKILLPTNATAWVNASFVSNNIVVPRKLNVRSDPGENFSVLGQLSRGEPIQELGTKTGWVEIKPPTNAFAFIAAQFLKQEAPGTTPTPPPESAPAPATVTEPPPLAAATTEKPAPAATNAPAEPSSAPSETPSISTTNPPGETAMTSTNPPATEEPPPKRIVEREGVVRGTVSIQAPTHFALVSPENGKLIDYLYTTSPSLDLRRYKGLRIVVTGEEGLEERWGNTPIITIQKIQVMDE